MPRRDVPSPAAFALATEFPISARQAQVLVDRHAQGARQVLVADVAMELDPAVDYVVDRSKAQPPCATNAHGAFLDLRLRLHGLGHVRNLLAGKVV